MSLYGFTRTQFSRIMVYQLCKFHISNFRNNSTWGCFEGPTCLLGKTGFICVANNLNCPTTFSDCILYQICRHLPKHSSELHGKFQEYTYVNLLLRYPCVTQQPVCTVPLKTERCLIWVTLSLRVEQGRIKLFGAPQAVKTFPPLISSSVSFGGVLPPRPDSQTPRLPVPRQK